MHIFMHMKSSFPKHYPQTYHLHYKLIFANATQRVYDKSSSYIYIYIYIYILRNHIYLNAYGRYGCSYGPCASNLVSQWNSTINPPQVHAITNQYPSLYDLRSKPLTNKLYHVTMYKLRRPQASLQRGFRPTILCRPFRVWTLVPGAATRWQRTAGGARSS